MTAAELLAAEAASASLVDVQYEHTSGVIDLTWGHPDPSTFALDAIGAATTAVLASHGWQTVTYGAPHGAGYTRDAIAAHLSATDTMVHPDEVIVTAGSSGGLDLLLTMLAVPGDVVIVEQPTYFLALRMFADHGLRIVGVAGDEHGPDPAAVAEIARSAAAQGIRAFLYVVPTYANPTGGCLPLDRQLSLLEVAAAHHIQVIEDDVYRDTSPVAPPSMWSLNRDVVMRLGSFSKSLSPGLRVGYLTAGPAIIERIGGCGLLDSGGGVNHFASMVVGEMMHSGSFQTVAAAGQLRYAERRAALADALDPSLFDFSVPDGGYFLWLKLPGGVTSSGAVAAAHERGVDVSDGRKFFVDATDSTAVRVSFSMLSTDVLREGADRLNAAVRSLVS